MVKETVKVTRVSLAMVTALGALVGVGCSDNNDLNLVPLVATFITVNAGSNGQTGTAGQLLANPIVVHVTDQNSNALAGVSVAWAVVGAGGSVSAASSLTNASGDATVNWTLGTAVALDSLTASLANGTSVTITATATAAGSSIDKISGDQSIPAGSTSAPMVVKIVNANGTGIGGATVAWSVQNGGTLSALSTTTGPDGQTSVTLATSVLPGTAIVTATGPSGAAVNFSVQGN